MDAVIEHLQHPTTFATLILAIPIFHRGTQRLLTTWWAKLQLSFFSSVIAEEAQVSNISIYPVKSLRTVDLKTVKIDDCGLAQDRRFMLVCPSPPPAYGSFLKNDPTHRFITQRQCPSLATVTAKYLRDDLLRLSRGETGGMTVHTKFDAKDRPIYKARLWDRVVQVVDMGDDAAAFFRDVAGEEVPGIRLTQMVAPLKANDAYVPPEARTWWGTPPNVALTDGFPVLIACEASLQEVNRRLQKKGKDPIPMARFRPNIVIKNTLPFEEDTWKVIQIGSTYLHIVKGCPRCKSSCTDQETGQVHDEPLKTLSDFRTLGHNPEDVYFAQNAIAYGGSISKGDVVKILKIGEPVCDKEDVKPE